MFLNLENNKIKPNIGEFWSLKDTSKILEGF